MGKTWEETKEAYSLMYVSLIGSGIAGKVTMS
jgi:hypothetical protein